MSFRKWLYDFLKVDESVKKQLAEAEHNKIVLEAQVQHLREVNQELDGQLRDFNNKIDSITELQETGYEYTTAPLNSDKLIQLLADNELALATLVQDSKHIQILETYTVNKSVNKGAKMQLAYIKNLLTGFNAYVNAKEKAITSNNYYQSVDLIEKSFARFNNQAKTLGVQITPEYKDIRLKIMKNKLDIKNRKAEERETMRKEKRKLKEQEQLLAEAEKAKAELQKERRMYEQSLVHALNEQERQAFESKLKEIDKREADVDYRINHTSAGYLYITATKAMPGMVKIGVTRRLNPLVRISELSSASVPYPFVCYGLVFDDDVFKLEADIHNYFDKQRVNVENKRKEFFYISPDEAIKVLREEFKCKVYFVNNEENEEEE